MSPYPVHYFVEKPARFTRAQLVVRVIALFVLGLLGLSLGTVFLVLCIGLPAFAAIRLAGRDATEYLDADGPRVVRALHWYAAIYGWFGMVLERLPSRRPHETVRIEVEPEGTPTAPSALWRLLLGIPSAVVLIVLAAIGALVWLWAAIAILVHERYSDVAFRYLAGLQRWSVRLLAYQASIVEAYPPFSFEETPALGETTTTPLPAG